MVNVSEPATRLRHADSPKAMVFAVMMGQGRGFNRVSCRSGRGRSRADKTPRPRSKEGAYTSRISPVRNVETLLGSASGRQGVRLVGQWANRKDGLTPQEDKMSQEAKGADRKVTGSHNRAQRAALSGETRPARVLTWGRGSGDETAEHRNTMAKVRYGPCGCKQTHRGATLFCQ